jgi:hypothetical protein
LFESLDLMEIKGCDWNIGDITISDYDCFKILREFLKCYLCNEGFTEINKPRFDRINNRIGDRKKIYNYVVVIVIELNLIVVRTIQSLLFNWENMV